MSASLPPELLHALELTIYHVRLGIVMGVVGYTAMMYDHILTFTDEVQYIWRAPMSSVSLMFLLNRYITPVFLAIDLYDKGGIASYISYDFCITWYYLEAAWYACSFAVTHALVAMRVAAIWGRPHWIIILLSSLWFAYFSITCTILFTAASQKAYTVRFEPVLRLCYLEISPFLWACWVPPIVLEVILFALSWIQAYRARRYAARTPIIYVLSRDGALYFLVIVFCSFFNIITWMVAPPALVALAKYFSIAIVNVMVSRLVLNLRSCQRSSHLPKHQHSPSLRCHVEEVEMNVPLSPSEFKAQV